jgi:PAS domain S-box-containing protein
MDNNLQRTASASERAIAVRRVVAYWLAAIGLPAFLLVVGWRGRWIGDADLHTDMEVISTAVALIVGMLALTRFYSRKDNTFLFVGVGFLGAAVLDGYHAFVTSEVTEPFLPSHASSPAMWSWMASRLFLSAALAFSVVAWHREKRLGNAGTYGERAVYLGAAALVLVTVGFFAFVPLPQARGAGGFLPRPQEMVPAILFLAAAVGYLRKGHWREDVFERWLILSLVAGVVGQAAFMVRAQDMFGYEFNVAHLLKIVGYILALIGLLGNSVMIYREAERSQRRLHDAIAGIQEGFALFDADDRLVICNNEYLRLHPNLRDVIKPGVRFEEIARASIARKQLVEAIGREEAFLRERLWLHRNPAGPILRELADGTFYLINEARLPDGGFAVTQTEITELKEAEKALRAREALTRRMLETSPVGVLITTRDGRHLFANERALEIQGVTRDELFAANARQFYADPTVRDRMKDELYKTGYTPPTPVELMKPNGATYFVNLSSALIEYKNQLAHLTYLYDISELKRTEQALRQSRERTRAIVDNIIDGIVTIDAKGEILSVNRKAAEIFGYAETELVGQNVNVLMPEPHRSGHDRYLANYAVTGSGNIIGKTREVEGVRRNGRRFPLEIAVNGVPFGNEQMFVGIVRDITERKEVERMKGEFVSTVSHELRTPLTSIRGSLGLLMGGAVGEVPEKVRAMLEMAEKNATRLITLVNDILDMEKLESGRMEFRFERLNLTSLVQQGITANDGYAREFGVKFVLAKSDKNVFVTGDHDRLTQVLANLLSNAAKFSPRGEKVEIAVSRRNDVARVSVADHGPGIPREFQGKIFGRFTQADASDSRKVGGTGLGLNISKTIVEKHGGTIRFDTQAGRGTTFHFELPLADEKPTPAGGVVT